jgi:hypothetical protein
MYIRETILFADMPESFIDEKEAIHLQFSVPTLGQQEPRSLI